MYRQEMRNSYRLFLLLLIVLVVLREQECRISHLVIDVSCSMEDYTCRKLYLVLNLWFILQIIFRFSWSITLVTLSRKMISLVKGIIVEVHGNRKNTRSQEIQ